MNQFLPIAMLLAALSWAGCSFAPSDRLNRAEDTLPEVYYVQADTARLAQEAWWTEFNDPVLNALVDTALVRNLDLRVAVARVRELQQQYRIQRGELFPAVSGSGSYNYSESPSNVGATGEIGRAIPNFPDKFTSETYSASLGLSYELDFWGRVRDLTAAALNEYLATKAEQRSTEIAIISETIATYYELDQLEQAVDLTRQNIEVLQERLEVSQDRYDRGLLTSFELFSIRQEFENLRTSLPLLESALFEAKGRLNIVLGSFGAETEAILAKRDRLDVAPMRELPAGLPSEILEDRPDVLAAGLRLEAARRRIGVARAQLFPTISITGSFGTQSSELADLVNIGDQQALGWGAALLQPILNGGALRANVRAAWERYEQSMAAYEKTVFVAFKEVQSTLVAYEKERERQGYLVEELAFALASLETQEQRYTRGVGDFVTLLDARRNLLRVRTSMAEAQRSVLISRLNFHRALGGSWLTNDDQKES